MPDLRIVLEADGMFENVPQEKLQEVKIEAIGALERGMSSGAPSVVISFTDGDKVYFAQTSMALFQGAARAFKSKFNLQD